MKNKKIKSIIKLFLLIILIIPITSYKQENIITQKKEHYVGMPDNHVEVNLKIKKTNAENELLSGVEFILRDIDNKLSVPITEKEAGIYSLNGYQDFNSLNEALAFLPEDVQKKFATLKTKEDVEKAFPDCNGYYFDMYLPGVIEETNVPTGYIKEKYIIPVQAVIDFYYDSTDNSITDVIIIYDISTTEYMKYDIEEDYTKFDQEYKSGKYKNKMISCVEIEDVQSKSTIVPPACQLEIINEKIKYELSIETLINESKSVTTEINKTLNYKVLLKNKSNIKTTNNKIITRIPKEIKVQENSISNKGVYNKEKHQIEWNIAEINVNETQTLTFKAIAPNTVNEKELSTTTEVTSDEITDPVISEKATLTIIDNPTTSNNIFILIIISIVLTIGIVITITTSKKTKDNTI